MVPAELVLFSFPLTHRTSNFRFVALCTINCTHYDNILLLLRAVKIYTFLTLSFRFFTFLSTSLNAIDFIVLIANIIIISLLRLWRKKSLKLFEVWQRPFACAAVNVLWFNNNQTFSPSTFPYYILSMGLHYNTTAVRVLLHARQPYDLYFNFRANTYYYCIIVSRLLFRSYS